MYAIKDNRQYKITEDEKQAFVDKGYKAELKDNKLVFEKAKTKESEEIAKLKAENKKLEAELKKLKEEGK